jgi:hypothetical protein
VSINDFKINIIIGSEEIDYDVEKEEHVQGDIKVGEVVHFVALIGKGQHVGRYDTSQDYTTIHNIQTAELGLTQSL